VRAEAAAHGIRPIAVLLDDLAFETLAVLGREARASGIDCLTGDDWALLSGGASALAGLIRPDTTKLPPELGDELARALGSALEPAATWITARGAVALERPVVAGILNLTPDSFSDGGRFLEPDAALRHAAQLVRDGADMIDLGAESTRPGRPEPVSADVEWSRISSVLAALVREHPRVPLSVDTVKAMTARRALDAGAWAINDVSGLRLEPEIADVCAAAGAGLILMHSRGSVGDMASYEHAHYDDVAGEVRQELQSSVERATARGVSRSQLVVDPGLGFAKTPEQTCTVVRELPVLGSMGLPIMVGPSRKRFLGAVTGQDVEHRDAATAAACVAAYFQGAVMFRVHAVVPTREALAVAHALRSS
jgi:dihydropteroate synthase